MRSEVDEIKTALRGGFAELLDHATQRLSVSQNGKKVIFRDSLITNMTEFFKYFNDRNIIGDGELGRLVERARGILSGIKPEELRRDDVLRDSIRDKLVEIRQVMDKELMLKPTRRIQLEDEPGEDPVSPNPVEVPLFTPAEALRLAASEGIGGLVIL
mgnify:CR=1 FL=1